MDAHLFQAVSFTSNAHTHTHAAAIASCDHVISGEVACGTQYHFTMETQVRLVLVLYDQNRLVMSTFVVSSFLFFLPPLAFSSCRHHWLFQRTVDTLFMRPLSGRR